MAAHLTPESYRFLRGLARHNDRAWFEERRPVYERAIKQPFQALVADINEHLAGVAPEHIRPPHKIVMRIFRDTRFSPDKRPYKTHLAAWWARDGLQKTSAAGFFLHLGPEGGYAAAGIYAPERDDLLLVRRWMAEHHERYRQVVAPLLRGAGDLQPMQPLDPNALTRNPKGFAPDHPASDLLRARNWGVTATLPAAQALDASCATHVAAQFGRCTALVNLLNEPFLGRQKASSSTASFRL